MDDEEFLRLLDAYPDPPAEPNAEMEGVQILWTPDNLRHIWEHRVREEEIEQVLREIPPRVEAKRSSEHPNRTLFWGATRHDRWLFVACEDWTEGDTRFLKPITAFEPDDGVNYWESIR
ncbi:MAG: hypothetical protein J4N31_04295 [Chloroflexi bacterium]|nr:hypothetical protein [Chloroflexota bacterium]